MMKNAWVRLLALPSLILNIFLVIAVPARALDWVKTLDGDSSLTVTREFCDTMEIVDTISSDTEIQVTLLEQWNPDELALIDHSVTAGSVSTASGSLEWTVTATAGGVSITKYFHVEESTWSQTVLQETLTPADGSQLTKNVTVNKYLPVLWIDSTYSSLVHAGENAAFAITYGNTGGYENNVMIRTEFPPTALFSSANPAPDREDAGGTWAEWDVGDLGHDQQGMIQVTASVAAGLPPSAKIEILSEIYNHVDDKADTVLTKLVISSPVPALSNWGIVAFSLLIFISVCWRLLRRKTVNDEDLS